MTEWLLYKSHPVRPKVSLTPGRNSSTWMDPAKMCCLSGSSAVPACSPSWIAFGSKSEAEKFQKGFGGEINGFEDALKERMKQPKMMEKMPK